jgi:glycosyltransferase involved in cell wall biosynthesis
VPDNRRDEPEQASSPDPRLDPGSISVVVPTFNDVTRLGDALASIVSQTLLPAEIVVADDGSTDRTEQFVREFGERRAGEVIVRYLRLASRSGVVAARNEGISATTGEWIATCDSDDVWAPTKLERQTAFLRDWNGRQRIALLATHGLHINDAKRIVSPAIMGPTSEAEYDSVRRAGGGFYLLHSSVLYRRSDYEAIGGYTTEYGAADDFDFFCRMGEQGVVIAVAEPLVYYRKRAGSVQLARFWDKQRGELRVVENQRRRATGRSPVGEDEFAAQLASAPVRQRLRRRKQTLGMYYYRRGAANMANRRLVRGGVELLLASIMDGARVRAGVLNTLRGRVKARGARARAERSAGGS